MTEKIWDLARSKGEAAAPSPTRPSGGRFAVLPAAPLEDVFGRHKAPHITPCAPTRGSAMAL